MTLCGWVPVSLGTCVRGPWVILITQWVPKDAVDPEGAWSLDHGGKVQPEEPGCLTIVVKCI